MLSSLVFGLAKIEIRRERQATGIAVAKAKDVYQG